jgi:hypothetical protein
MLGHSEECDPSTAAYSASEEMQRQPAQGNGG